MNDITISYTTQFGRLSYVKLSEVVANLKAGKAVSKEALEAVKKETGIEDLTTLEVSAAPKEDRRSYEGWQAIGRQVRRGEKRGKDGLFGIGQTDAKVARSYTAQIEHDGDINNLLRRHGNGACAE